VKTIAVVVCSTLFLMSALYVWYFRINSVDARLFALSERVEDIEEILRDGAHGHLKCPFCENTIKRAEEE
jgi:hypothetical protein